MTNHAAVLLLSSLDQFLSLFLSLVKIWIFPSPEFYLLVVDLCVFPSVSFPLFFILFWIFFFPPLYSLSLDFSAVEGMTKLVEGRFECLYLTTIFMPFDYNMGQKNAQ